METRTASRPRTWIKWAIGAPVGLIVLSALILWLLGTIAAKRYDTFVAELKSQGAMLDFADLRSARPPGTTFFDGPAEHSATAFLSSDSVDVSLDEAEWKEVQRLGTKLFELDNDEQERARAIVKKQKELIERVKEVSSLPPTRIEDIIKLTALNQSALSRKMPDLLALRNLANLLALDAYVAYTDGRADDALATYGCLLKLGQHLRDVPDGVSQMIGGVLSAIGLDNLSRIAVDADFSDEGIKSFIQILDSSGIRESLGLVYAGELALFQKLYKEMDDPQTEDSPARPKKWNVRRLAWWLYKSPLFRFVRVRDEKTFTTILYKWAETSSLPYYQVKDEANEALVGWDTPISKIVIPNLMRLRQHYADAEFYIIRSKLALLVNRYKKDMGGYPESLTALRPKYLETVPLNPLTGNPLELQYLNAEDKEQMQKTVPMPHRNFFSVGGPHSDKYLLIE